MHNVRPAELEQIAKDLEKIGDSIARTGACEIPLLKAIHVATRKMESQYSTIVSQKRQINELQNQIPISDDTVNKFLDIMAWLYSCYFVVIAEIECGNTSFESFRNFREAVEEFSYRADYEEFQDFERIIRQYCEGRLSGNQLIAQITDGNDD